MTSRFTLLSSAASALLFITVPLTSPSYAQDANDADTDGAQETIVVTGSLTPRPESEIGSALTVLNTVDIEAAENVIVSDLLRSVPGLAVNRTGPEGALTQVRIRGAEANQTLVYIDGIEAANPALGEFNFANLVTADVGRIEILRGPQSALYGSEAIGGVISVITKDPEAGFQAEAEAEAGSFGTYRGFVALGGGSERLAVRGSIQYYDTQGISVAPTGSEEDGFDSINVSLKGLYTPHDRLRVETILRYTDSSFENDAQEFAFGTVQDADLTNEATDFLAKIDATGALAGDWLTGRAFLTYTDGESESFSQDVLNGRNNGTRVKYGGQLTASFGDGNIQHLLTGAVEREQSDFENLLQERSDTQTSLIGEYSLAHADSLFLSAAVRHDFNSVFDDATTYRVSAAYLFAQTGTRFHGSWGQGITDPTFNERFGFNPGTFIGNPDLVPEKSQGWDIGIEQSLFDGHAFVDVTYFSADLEDEIITQFLFENGQFLSTPINGAGESERSGVEVSLTAILFEGLSAQGQYTYLDATDPNGLVEVRRAEHIASLGLTYQTPDAAGRFHLGVDYNGEQEDSFFGFADPNFTPRRTLDAFTLVRLAGSYQIHQGIELFARAENVLDTDYEEVIGFNTPGAAAYGGLRARF